jgi:acyl dehydratase
MAPVSLALADLPALVGREVAVSPWVEITQERIDRFADATGDRQWIHVDRERARGGPFGGTIAHGFLVLSLLPALMWEALEVSGPRLVVNYGCNKVRFTSPVPAGSRVRARLSLAAVEPRDGAVQATWNVVVEREGGTKPGLVAEWIGLYAP